jgi:DNA-binding NarL/FixJ family response regulator
MAMSTSVAIADHHGVTRLGVKSVVDTVQGEVVATARTGIEAISVVEEHQPDLLVVSLKLPHLNGFDLLYHLQRRTMGVKVIVLTVAESEEQARAAFQRGASAYLRKQDPLDELVRAIEAVRAGQQYLSNALPQTLLDTDTCSDAASLGEEGALTLRERQVMQLTAEGYTSREVGTLLNVSHRTVEKHRENIKRKLDVGSLVDVVRFALDRQGMLDVRTLRVGSIE